MRMKSLRRLTTLRVNIHSDPKPDAPIQELHDPPNSESEVEDEGVLELEPDIPIPRRSGRERRPPERYGAPVGASAKLVAFDLIENAYTSSMEKPPDSFEEAMSRPDANLWLAAMLLEIKSIEQHKVKVCVDRPTDRNVIKCRWIFDYKRGPDGEITRYKARLVAKGFSQHPGIDYSEVSSPVAASDSFRVLMSIVSTLDLELLQIDVKTAFLHGELDEEIYMEQPQGFVEGKGQVWKLRKALYGLKQAARAFYMQLKTILEQMGFKRCDTDHAVFYQWNGKDLAIILAHVDDMLLAGNSLPFLEKIKADLGRQLEIVDLGEAKMFVGIEIQRDRHAGTLKISQRRYIKDILARFGMSDCKSCETPMSESLNLPKLAEPTIDRTLYQQLIGSLMYAMISTRADIAYATGLLAQHAANPGDEHWNAAKRIMRYLKGSIDLGIVYRRTKGLDLKGYVDADYAGDKSSSRSTTRWAFIIAKAITAYSSRKQPTISLSSTEAEYVASSSAARELIWIWQFLDELGLLPDGPTTVFSDNQSAMSLAKNPVNHQNTKHIRVKYHFIREVIALQELDLKFIGTEEQVADVLTKPLGRIKFTRFVSAMGMA